MPKFRNDLDGGDVVVEFMSHDQLIIKMLEDGFRLREAQMSPFERHLALYQLADYKYEEMKRQEREGNLNAT